MTRLLVGLLLLLLIATGIGLYCRNRPTVETLEPIQEADPKVVVSESALPADALAIDLAEVARLEPPFVLSPDASAAGGMALVLPKGTRDKVRSSHARIPFHVPSAGTFSVWLRVYWTDTCSNSISARMNDAPEKEVGNDELFGVWHWIPAGLFALKQGANELVLREREDGVALDQLLLVRDPEFQPTGRVEKMAFARTVRRFADDFSRSPGHGLENWRKVSGNWEILFSFDPNRIPLQYALDGKPEGAAPAVVLIKSPPWTGARLAFSLFPQSAGTCGVVIDRSADGQKALQIAFDVAADDARLTVSGSTARTVADLKGRLRLGQWHAVVVERWAWVLSVYLDETLVLSCTDLPPPAGEIGFSVASGSAVFDDVKLEELAWQADDGLASRILWKQEAGASWFRKELPEVGPTLLGSSGTISTSLPPLKVEAVLLDERTPGACRVAGSGLAAVDSKASSRILHRAPFGEAAPELSLTPAGGGEVQLRRVALAYGEVLPDEIVIGPYTFSERTIPDPSDYLDFTPAEFEEMRRLPEAEKYRRGEKPKLVIARRGDDDSPWYMDRGYWRLMDGFLQGAGPEGLLTYADDFSGTFEVRMKVRLPLASSVGQIMLCGDLGKPHVLQLARERTGAPAVKPDPFAVTLKDGAWHALRVRADNGGLALAVDGGAWRPVTDQRGDAGRFALGVLSGRVDFDDLEFRLPRRAPDGRNYSFMPAETDWWREARDGAKWIDHGGISCRLASSWISLLAPEGRGMIWNKQSFGADVAVASDITECSEWYGWDKANTHRHFPYDNICMVLGPECDENQGYRLEVNAKGRSETILYRNNQPVARVPQDYRFPIRYVGDHYPYYPRRNRVSLLKRGTELTAVVNSKVVLSYTDPQPLPVSRVGLGGYQTHINFGPIQIRELGKRK